MAPYRALWLSPADVFHGIASPYVGSRNTIGCALGEIVIVSHICMDCPLSALSG
jgi:hypothetical protein